MTYLAVGYFVLLFWLSVKRWRAGLVFLCFLLPAYLVRLTVFGLPTTLLEVTFSAVFLAWIWQYARADLICLRAEFKVRPVFFWLFLAFFIASLGAIFVSGIETGKYWNNTYKALGIWRAYFFEPMLFFAMIWGRARANALNRRDLAKYAVWSGVSIAVLAVWQKIFGGPFAPSLWNDILGGRATAFYTSPNAVGLFLVPLVFLAILFLFNDKNPAGEPTKKRPVYLYFVLMVLFLSAIFFSGSQGAWMALAGGLAVFGYLLGFKKSVIVAVLLGVALVFYQPVLRAAVLLRDPAGQNRLRLWEYSQTFLTAAPGHFFLGAGLRQFFWKVQYPFFKENTKAMEILTYPHNIFLNFWTETGLFGALFFAGLLAYAFLSGIKILRRDRLAGAALIALWAAFLIHGLVDVPYFKNDLAFLFWILYAVGLSL